ncbi:MAG: BREX-1 system adenine-specific DNA-methyltransferase PglX [Nitrospirae bacterium]|nr:BREX-1 system adenine-specific DNA-methyltransferase PglX [Nitrospirota bacterium]
MNKSRLKTYAPAAREEFIKAVTDRAHYYGISKEKAEPCTVQGDFAFIGGRAFPKGIAAARNLLLDQIKKSSFPQVIEEVAYTWFNRIAAIRFMEVNGYLAHGYRVLSHPEGHAEPEILEKAQFIERLDGLEKEEIIRLKMEAGKDNELYRRLLIAQCNDLNAAMPFLFERLDDPTELLLPDNLLNTDSVIRHMVSEIPEDDWKEVEIIGWLYQFYISEKKDALMKAKKAYRTEDIPAVTQLFTPNWIVKYMVQNSLGAKWLATYPASGIKENMEYYIEPAPQDEDVRARLKEITPEAINPEELTVLDPASGSGHILVEAYDLLKQIYLERGYREKDIPALILTRNLFGLEIDERAAQLSGFALMMKARVDDREIFRKDVSPNVICIKSGSGMVVHFKEAKELIALFENASTFGSLIRVPDDLKRKLPEIKEIADKMKSGDMLEQKEAEVVTGLLKQAVLLSRHYDCVIANPPYMGGKGMNATLKEFARSQYPDTKSDLFAMFIERGFEMAKDGIGYNAMVTMQSWMFLSSFEKMRYKMFEMSAIRNMVHMSNGVMGIAFGTNATVWINKKIQQYKGSFSFVDYSDLIEENIPREFPIKNDRLKDASSDDFKKIPGSPIAYWVSEKIRYIFENSNVFETYATPRQGLGTTNNDVFTRCWVEVNKYKINFGCKDKKEALQSQAKWFPYSKGGGFRKWYGNDVDVVNWEYDGQAIRKALIGKNPNIPRSETHYFKEGITWGLITSAKFSARYSVEGGIFDVGGSKAFPPKNLIHYFLGLLNSKLTELFLIIVNPTLNFQVGDLKRIPVVGIENITQQIKRIIEKIINIAVMDWDAFEISWNFRELAILRMNDSDGKTFNAYHNYRIYCHQITDQMKKLEEENNRIFIEAYGLQDELTPDVPIEEITLFANPHYRYKGDLTDDARETRFKEDTMKELISYAVSCMMGRYSLDIPGLVYAHTGNNEFDANKYETFPADEDGIIPITEREWFEDDAACRFIRFIETAWDKKGLDSNLDFIADAIGRKSGESSREVIRRYFADGFFKDHCQTYKNRPIYWLFSSGKEKAFQAIVYLHRYNEGTLSRMRTEYVLPLQTRISRQIEHLEKDRDAVSGSAANKIQREIIELRRQQAELLKFDELLRHYADKKIRLDLDDGVKVNYAKFGSLLTDVKKISGVKEEEDAATD